MSLLLACVGVGFVLVVCVLVMFVCFVLADCFTFTACLVWVVDGFVVLFCLGFRVGFDCCLPFCMFDYVFLDVGLLLCFSCYWIDLDCLALFGFAVFLFVGGLFGRFWFCLAGCLMVVVVLVLDLLLIA